MEGKICQSCGMPMKEDKDFGTNKDSSLNQDYCCYCYQNGDFTENCTMEEMIEHNIKFLKEFNQDANTQYSEDDARKELSQMMPNLKRWK